MSDKQEMIIGYKHVKYGLQKKSNNEAKQKALDIFGSDSSDDEDINKKLKKEQLQKFKESKLAAEYEKAIKEDKTVFEYDSIYDKMKLERELPKKLEKKQRKPKYIASLLQNSKNKKIEQDIAYERILLKERQKEDHLFGDKESFITEAYKKKLAENKLWMAKEKIEEEIEKKHDVTKKTDLSDFYHNLCSRNIAFSNNNTNENNNEDENTKSLKIDLKMSVVQENDSTSDVKESNTSQDEDKTISIPQITIKKQKLNNTEVVKKKLVDNSRRNDDKSISEARARYLERKRNKI